MNDLGLLVAVIALAFYALVLTCWVVNLSDHFRDEKERIHDLYIKATKYSSRDDAYRLEGKVDRLYKHLRLKESYRQHIVIVPDDEAVACEFVESESLTEALAVAVNFHGGIRKCCAVGVELIADRVLRKPGTKA